MVSTKEQVEAYAYEGRRQITSLLGGTDQAAADPRRRLNRSLAAGGVVAVLAMAGVGVAGLLGAGNGTALPDSGAVITDNGSRFVAVDGALHPALNLASALLVGGGQVTEVKESALGGKPRGLPVGIPGAPDSLPSNEKLTDGGWTECATSSAASAADPRVELLIGTAAPAEGRLAPDQALVVAHPDGRQWLVMRGRRYLLDSTAQGHLGLRLAHPVPLPAEVIATVPEGPPIQAHPVPGAGTAASVPGISGVVGDLVRSSSPGTGDQFSVLEPDGLTPITPFVFVLMSSAGSRVVDVAPGVANAAPKSAAGTPGSPGWPEAKPRATAPQHDQPVCFSTTPGAAGGDAAWPVEVSLPAAAPSPPGFSPVTTSSGDVRGVLRSVLMRPGSGAVVRASSTGGQDGTYTLVTDAGQRYPIAGADAVQRLRYSPNAVKNVPKPFVDLLPAGPVLDPAAAAVEFPGN